jgi:purine-binding chemotaxis protein CheW
MNFEHLSQLERALLEVRAKRLNQTEHPDTNKTLEVVILTIDHKRYALELQDLRAVLRAKITKLPGLNPVIAGAINVQGELVSVLELSLLMGLELSEATDECVLLVNSQHGNVGLRIPNLPELETIDAINTSTVLESTGLNKGKIVVLNIQDLLYRAEQALVLQKNV